MDKFKKLGISNELLRAIEEHKFENPTEIQEKAIPLVLEGKDVIAGASTGSGKTLAFGASIVQNCEKQGVIQALVLVPTRELADQVAKNLEMFSKYKDLRIAEVYGGVSMNPQIFALKHADVAVATPGRILDHIERQTVDLRYVRILVLDEADRMLDMGFIKDVEKIIQRIPRERQTMLFSATLSKDINQLARNYMNNPVEVSAESYVDPSKLAQVYYDVPDSLKFSLLVKLLNEEHEGLVMVFCNTQRNTDFVAENLMHNGIEAVAIHGGISQDRRNRIMEQFHGHKVAVLVCTDVAARGLDIKGVSHVYNYDIPNMPEQYVHRIGRTARAGKEGKAVNILASRDYENFINLKKHTSFEILKEELPKIDKVSIIVRDRFSRRRFAGPSGGARFERSGGRGEGFRSDRRHEDRGHNRERPSRFNREHSQRRFSRSSSFSRDSDNSSDGKKSVFGFRNQSRTERREERHRFHRRF
jgi:ATP-dependent RNA helicase DeaD